MVLNRQRHTDGRHRGDAGRNTAGGLAGLDENAELTAATLPASVRQNIALGAFEISMLKTESVHSMLDGVRDVFNDADGILIGGDVAGGKLVCTEYESSYGTASASSVGSRQPGEAFDASSITWWDSDTDADEWISVAMPAPFVCNRYGIWVRGAYPDRLPKDWTLEGSNTGAFGGEEVTIDTQTGITAGGYFNCSNTVAYSYYRMVITANGGGSIIEIMTFDILNTGENVYSVSSSAEAQPTNIHAVILADDAAITLNTDLKFYVSVDDGATWEQVTLSDSGDYSATEKILTGSVAVAGTGTTIKYKIECTDAAFEFYAVGLLWD